MPANDKDGRQDGSGRYHETATAIEQLLAQLISGRKSLAEHWLNQLTFQAVNDRCGMDPLVIWDLLSAAARQMYPDFVPAARLFEGEGPGDVEVDSRPPEWIEVKAQTTKEEVAGHVTHRDLTQADWARDSCHVLRFLNESNEEFRAPLSTSIREAIGLPVPAVKSWSIEDLWLADLVGLTSAADLSRHAVRSGAQLREFILRKRVVLLNRSGLSHGFLSSIPAVSRLEAGTLNFELVTTNRESLIAVRMSTVGPPAHSRVDFTYHVYPPKYGGGASFVGRHKLHAFALDSDGAGPSLNSIPALG